MHSCYVTPLTFVTIYIYIIFVTIVDLFCLTERYALDFV